MRTTRSVATTVAIVAVAGYARVARAQQPSDSIRLSRQQAITQALAHNAQLAIAHEQTEQARAAGVSGSAIPDPYLSAAIDQASNPIAFSGAQSRPVSIGFDVPFPDKFRLNNRIGRAGVAASESNYRLQQQSVALQTSSTYDSLLAALIHRDNLTEALTLANDFLTRTQARFNAGTAARLDVIQAQLGVAQAQNDIIGNERDLANAQASLNRVLGMQIGMPIAPTDSLGVPPALPDSSMLETIAMANRPELSILRSEQAGAHAGTALAKEYWLPDLNFGVGRDYIAPGSPMFTTGFTIPLPVFFWQHSRGDIALSQHFERELEATYRDLTTQIAQDVRSAYANASTAMRQVVFLRDELVPAARDAYRIASTSYTLGGSSALEVLTAHTALLEAEAEFADALADANTARADLDRALGITASPGAGIR
jgi:cobalt-zinc-cadmium efflux system outer membrane protein